MSDNSTIEWTDATWNPVTGCTKVSPGCDNCYAETFAERWRGTPGHYFEKGFDVQLRPAKLDQPLKWKRPRRIFVNSMSDLFHKDVPDEYVRQVFAVMAQAERHTFQVLTKRHGRQRALLSRIQPDPLPNVHLGVSVENQQWASMRIPALIRTPAAVRILSCEPLLAPLDLTPWLGSIDWVIVGGESGRTCRPMNADWVRALRDQCVQAGVPFLFKQWGGRTPKANGRELDGRTWDEFPT